MKYLTILLLLISPFFCNAQDFKFGLKSGLNLSTYRGENDGGQYKLSGYAGVFSNYEINQNIEVQTELVYARIGHRDTINDTKIKTSLGYLQIPILLKITLNNYEQFKLIIGPQISYLLDSNITIDGDSDTDKSNFEELDYGATVGMEYQLSEQFSIDVRYYLGLSDFYNQSEIKSSAKNSAFSLGLAFRF
ncbi:PorT family protein [Labilibaculum sp. DW002]|uniref:PorT family protein n=1 Tax=Paralabilibaculum antarcticum TaxID=2912572 RepID=A0ABT5VM88_9BACT|nr:porin family protein [Labilibaculum sp. DW002]MDE5416541.1 PorT family protein [Labilibaculum sp. DW002]